MGDGMTMELLRERTALVVIDMQNAFLHEDTTLAKRGLDNRPLWSAIAPCARLLALARASRVPVIHTRYVYLPDYSDAGVRVREITPSALEHRSLTAGSWEAEIDDRVAPAPGEIVIDKNRPSAFIGTPLDTTLRSMRIESLVICGVTTNICVESTARDASQYDYRTFVVSDATAEMDPSRYENALKTLAFLFARVLTVDEVEQSWSPRTNA